jgi:hypothetical protein
LPSGEVKTYKVKSSGIVEINSSGEEISDSFLIESGSNEFFSFSPFTTAFIAIALLLQVLILIDDAYGMSAWKRLFIQSANYISINFFRESLY